ncbi:MAG: hypothetical protein H0W46_05255 [Acidimicrobiia bacterium]|nr:hypothetical protein [Acidimicrobiia bacterium]
MTTVGIVGHGVVADRVRRLVATTHEVREHDLPAEIVVLAMGGPHAPRAAELLRAGVHVISTSGGLDDIRSMLDLDDDARAAGVTLVVGAAASPGLSGLLARYLVAGMSGCDELHVAVHGTAGPACAREHHDALGGWAVGWHDDDWIERSPAGSGRELCWFPEPVGARDCYRAGIPDPVLLRRAFPAVRRISARVSATRRDRLTARFPMLSPPHREGGVGALRVEARGNDEHGGRVTPVAGIAELIGTAAAAVAGAFVDHVADGAAAGVLTSADADLPALELLRAVGRGGVRVQAFTGIPHE